MFAFDRYKVENVLGIFPHIKLTKNLYFIRMYTYERKKFSLWFLVKTIDK